MDNLLEGDIIKPSHRGFTYQCNNKILHNYVPSKDYYDNIIIDGEFLLPLFYHNVNLNYWQFVLDSSPFNTNYGVIFEDNYFILMDKNRDIFFKYYFYNDDVITSSFEKFYKISELSRFKKILGERFNSRFVEKVIKKCISLIYYLKNLQ